MSINASIACLLLMVSKREGVLCAALVVKGIGKAGRQPLVDFVGQLHPERGGGVLAFDLKLQLHDLKKRRVLAREEPSKLILFLCLFHFWMPSTVQQHCNDITRAQL